MTIKVAPLTDVFAAEVSRADLTAGMDSETFAPIRAAFEDLLAVHQRHVVVFRFGVPPVGALVPWDSLALVEILVQVRLLIHIVGVGDAPPGIEAVTGW